MTTLDFNLFPNKAWFFTCLQYMSFENTVGKGEIAHDVQFLLFPQCLLSAIFNKFAIVVCKVFESGEPKICLQAFEFMFQFPLQDNHLDLSDIIKNLAKKTVIHHIKGISKSFLGEEQGDHGPELHLKTEGINMEVCLDWLVGCIGV